MIDFHTHILPGIDDGSREVRETVGMLQEEIRQGVHTIVATPHFYANRISVEGFLRRREQSIRSLDAVFSRGGEIFHFTGVSGDPSGISNGMPQGTGQVLPELFTGAEVYFFPGMGRAEKLRELCIRRADAPPETAGQVILIEMPFEQWTGQTLQELRDIILKQQLRIVLAHVERYPEFQRDKEIWNQVMDLPVTIQLNAGSFLKTRARRKFCLRMLQDHQNVILGSDCHNLSSRRPNLAEAANVIARKLGRQRVEQLEDRASQLLQL